MKFLSGVIAVLIFSFGVDAKTLVGLEQFPKWFKDAVARDTKVKKSTKLKIPALNIDGRALGKYTLAEESEGFWYYIIDVGIDSPVECYIFSEFDGPANSLSNIIDQSLTGVEALNNKKLSARFNYAIDTGVIDNIPYLQLDTLYNLGQGNEKVAGILKGAAALVGETLQICIHNELGYQQAFIDVFESFVTTVAENQAKSAFFEPIYHASIGDTPIGYSHEIYTTDADGDVSIQKHTAFLIPVDASSISRSDSVATEWSYPDGSVINSNVYTIDNGVIGSSYDLSRSDDKWHVEGQLQDKPIKAELAYTGWLLSGFGSHLETKKLLASTEESAEFNMWVSDADPTSAMIVKLSKITGNPDANLKIDMGPFLMDFQADEKGIFRKGTMEQGPISVTLTLMYSHGEPKIP
ncbi:hypothetical protein [Paraglaciecola sp. 2405UD69-4]|uniref:hypothetical protein n=1 Tax=Paraglaciecola sp. 2405UD69-4 TaxID=3391836 RepID=UPI0039C998EA